MGTMEMLSASLIDEETAPETKEAEKVIEKKVEVKKPLAILKKEEAKKEVKIIEKKVEV